VSKEPRHHMQWIASATSSFFEAAFRPKTRPGDQRNVVAVIAKLIFDRQQRVLLSTADDQSGDEMNNVQSTRSASLPTSTDIEV
jgi:hypothetical protein